MTLSTQCPRNHGTWLAFVGVLDDDLRYMDSQCDCKAAPSPAEWAFKAP